MENITREEIVVLNTKIIIIGNAFQTKRDKQTLKVYRQSLLNVTCLRSKCRAPGAALEKPEHVIRGDGEGRDGQRSGDNLGRIVRRHPFEKQRA